MTTGAQPKDQGLTAAYRLLIELGQKQRAKRAEREKQPTATSKA